MHAREPLACEGRADGYGRLFEDDAQSVIEVRTDSLQTLRELGPPDLVHLVKQPAKSSASKQVSPTAWNRKIRKQSAAEQQSQQSRAE